MRKPGAPKNSHHSSLPSLVRADRFSRAADRSQSASEGEFLRWASRMPSRPSEWGPGRVLRRYEIHGGDSEVLIGEVSAIHAQRPPWRANLRAMANPIPCPPPVTPHTRPSKRSITAPGSGR